MISEIEIDSFKQKSLFAMDEPVIRRLTLISLLLALFYSWFSAPMSARHFTEITITATGKQTSPQASGAQVWILSPKISALKNRKFEVLTNQGWQKDGDVFYCAMHQPARIIMRGYFSRQEGITFLRHPWSGEAKVEINGRSQSLDLYHPRTAYYTIPINDYLPLKEAGGTSILLEDLIRLVKYFLLTFSIFMLLYPVYLALPFPTVPKQNALPYLITHRFKQKQLILLLSSVVVFSLFSIAFYPGVMTDDSFWQYRQVVQYKFSDWHPPIMGALWILTNSLVKGPGGIFILHLFAAIVALYLLSRVALEKGKRLFSIPLLLIFAPSVSSIIFVIWKDVSLAMSFLLAFSLWYYFDSKQQLNKRRMLGIIGLVFYGWCVRHNALAAAIPLLLVFFHNVTSRKRVALICIILIGFFSIANFVLTYKLLRSDRSFITQVVFSHDLMAIYSMTGKNYFPAEYLTQARLDQIIKNFDPFSYLPTTQIQDEYLTSDSSIFSKQKAKWITGVLENPGPYLHHRWRLYKKFLTEAQWITVPVSQPATPDLVLTPALREETILGHTHTMYVTWVAAKFALLFKPIFYLFMSCVILIFSMRRRIAASTALCLSAIFYLVPYFFMAPVVNYRLTYWSTLATLISLIVFWIESGPREATTSI